MRYFLASFVVYLIASNRLQSYLELSKTDGTDWNGFNSGSSTTAPSGNTSSWLDGLFGIPTWATDLAIKFGPK